MKVEEVKKLLGLKPHPREGGWFVQTWKADEQMPRATLPARYSGPRVAGTAIYYLLEPDTYSEMHRLASDEVFHCYMGDPVEMLQLFPDGESRTVVLGTDLAAGMSPQVVVPKMVWQGSHLLPGGEFALLGCTVSPGFEFDDYEAGRRKPLSDRWSSQRPLIELLTRE